MQNIIEQGTRAYFDAFGGLVPVVVEDVTADPDYAGDWYWVKVTRTGKGYTYGERLIVPRTSLVARRTRVRNGFIIVTSL